MEGSKKISKELIEQINQLMNEFEKQELDYVLIVGSRVDEKQMIYYAGIIDEWREKTKGFGYKNLAPTRK